MEFLFRSVSVRFEKIPALNDVSCDINDGDIVVLTGPTGAGKTTLLRLMYMDLYPSSGAIFLNGQDTRTIKKRHLPGLRRKMGIVFQDFKLLDSRTVYENVIYPLYAVKTPKKEADKRCLEVLSEIGISYLRNKFPHQLSGGEKHLTALARAITLKPELILADEPTGNLDAESAKKVAALLRQVVSGGATVVLATHSKEMVDLFPEARRFALREGVIAAAPALQREAL